MKKLNETSNFELGLHDQDAHLPKLNENIVIRTAYVTIQPYDLPKSVRKEHYQTKIPDMNSGVSLRTDTARHRAYRESAKQSLLSDSTAVTESESSQSMRSSSDFFNASKQTGKLEVPANPTKAKSSVMIKNDAISFDNLRRTSQSMTSMAKLFQKVPNKMQSVAAEIRYQNMEYAALLESLQKTSDRKTSDRIQRKMESCKSKIRSSIKLAMFEQRKNKSERFEPIPINQNI